MITDVQYSDLVDELASEAESGDDEPAEVFAPVTSLWQLQGQCTASSASAVGRAIQAEARLNAVIAAAALCGESYNVAHGWSDAVQDLVGLQKDYRREEWRRKDMVTPHAADYDAWQQADARLLERINHAIRSYYEALAAEIEDEMNGTNSAESCGMVRRCNRCNAHLPGAVGVCTCGCPEFRITDDEDQEQTADVTDRTDHKHSSVPIRDIRGHQPSAEPTKETTMRTATAKRPQQSAPRPGDLSTFNDWQAELASHLPHWEDPEWQRRNEELLDLFHGGVSVLDAVIHFQKLNPDAIPETQDEAAAKEAAAANGVKPKARKPRTPNAQRPTSNIEQAEASAGETLIDIAVSDIVAAPWNPRTEFDQGRLKELADSIKKLGLLQPVLVRSLPDVTKATPGGGVPAKRYELVAGERRWRAAKLAKLKTIAARVVDITDEEAMEACVAENWDRDDLNPLDRARAVKLLIEGAGLTQAAAAVRLGLKDAATVSNILFPLELPAAWQQRIVSQDITATHARHLRSWLKRENVLDRVMQKLDAHLKPSYGLAGEGTPPTVKEFEKLVNDAAHECSKPLRKAGHEWDRDACLFSVTAKRKEELDVQPVPQKWGGPPANRAFNVKLWSQLQREAKAKQKQAAGKTKTDKGAGAKVKAADRSPSGWQIEQHLERWLSALIAVKVPDMTGEQILKAVLICSTSASWSHALRREQIVAKVLGAEWSELDEVMAGWLQASLASDFSPPDLSFLLPLARSLSIDPAADWSPSAELLAKYSDNLLRKMPQGKKAPEDLAGEKLAEWMAANWPAGSKLPKEIAKLLK